MDNASEIINRFQSLDTERLLLRRIRKSDAQDMFEYAQLESVTRYLLWRPHPNVRYTSAYIGSLQRYYKNGSFFDYAVILKAEDKMIGTCGFAHLFTEHNSAEIGYVINPAYHDKGYATEAAGALVRFGFCNAGLNRIEARYMIGNDASRRVMEKCGMIYEGTHVQSMYVKDKYVDIGVCAITSDRYRAIFGSLPANAVLSKYPFC